MNPSRLAYLYNCYANQNASPGEERELMELISKAENKETVLEIIDEFIKNSSSEIKMPDEIAVSILQHILQKDEKVISFEKNKKRVIFLWMRVAACVLLFGTASIIWTSYQKVHSNKSAIAVIPKPSPIMPGQDKAILTLSDGTTVTLDSMKNGTSRQGRIQLNKKDGLLVYEGASSNNGKLEFNTLSTPRGGQYQLILSDGSKVWLNASSSLHFPASFTGNDRQVTLKGEAYFEVAKNKEKPFRVKVENMVVNVLGTHFNVNAYEDESSIKTSLLEGSVKITQGRHSDLLKPGQQAILDKQHKELDIVNADMSEVVAWKNGLFQFDGANIQTIMNQISRWYDVDIIYEGKASEHKFYGKISRDAQLADVLKILKLSNVQFVVEGKKIIVQ